MLMPRARTITFEAALRDLGSNDPRVRVAAADALGDAEEAEIPKAVAALVSALRDARFEVRCAAALALGDLGDGSVYPALFDLLDEPSPEVRQAAVCALGRLGSKEAFEPLVQALREGSADVRFQAAASLVEIDAERAYDPLVCAIRDPDSEVRANVAAALGAVGDRRAAGWIAELLDDPRPDTCLEAALALTQLGDARGTQVLIKNLGHRDRAWEVIEALERVGGPGAVPALDAQARRFFLSPFLRVRAAAAVLSLALDPKTPQAVWARKHLAKAATSRRTEIRELAQELLARQGPASLSERQ